MLSPICLVAVRISQDRRIHPVLLKTSGLSENIVLPVWRAGSPDINAGEQEQPDDVDKMPIPGCCFKTEMLLGREVALDRSKQTDNQEYRTDDHMGTMKARRHIES